MLKLDGAPRLSVVVDGERPEHMPHRREPAISRPGDRQEPILIESTPEMVRLWSGASHRRLPGALVLALVVEAHLTQIELRRVFGPKTPRALDRLDALAEGARIPSPTTGPSSDYLRTLLGLNFAHGESAGTGSVIVPIPMRLVGAIAAGLPEEAAASTPIDQAVAWEIAAVASGRTISEWAPWALLDRLAGKGTLA